MKPDPHVRTIESDRLQEAHAAAAEAAPRTAEEVIDRFLPFVYRLAYAKTLNRTDADDLSQEVMLRYLDYLPEFASAEHAKAWFIKVTCQRVVSLKRKPWQRDLSLDRPLRTDESQGDTFIDQIRAEDTSGRDELKWDLDRAMSRLKPQEREVLHLFYYEDMSGDQIAQLLDRRPGTVRMQLKRAREALRRELETE